MQISDMISEIILKMLDESEMNTAEIRRNVLANELGCVPSQINYVLSSRFTPEQGYIIESRRGGGGFIRIRRIQVNKSSALMHIVNSIGEKIDPMASRVAIENMHSSNLISEEAAQIINAAIGNSSLKNVPPVLRDFVRADILKQILMTQIGRN